MADNGNGWTNRIVEYGVKRADQFQAHPQNWRTHPKAQREALKASLDGVGWVDIVKENVRTGHLIDGHERLWDALEKGDDTPVPYIGLDLSEDEELLVLATLDPITGMAVADRDRLEGILAELRTTALVQDDAALDTLLHEIAARNEVAYGEYAEPAGDPGAQLDRAEALQEEWGTARGQVWEIPSASVPGRNHRLMCGDSTSAEDVARLMAGEKAGAVVTDPPYGVGVDYGDFEDNERNVSGLIQKFMPIIQAMNIPIALTPGVPAMWSYPRPSWLMVWVHPAPSGSCPWGFAGVNPILVYGKDPYLQAGLGRRPDSISLAADREGVADHPTPKPIKVWNWLVERMTVQRGQIIFDPFAGSGTGIVAAEQTRRIGYGCDIEPKYIAVTLQRLADMGLEPRLIENA